MTTTTNKTFRTLLFSFAALFAVVSASPAAEPAKTYIVRSVEPSAITIDGTIADSEWPAEGWEKGFAFPWRDRKTPRTEMCCVCDGKRLLFAFRCDDADLVLRGNLPEDEMAVADGDRVELFFGKDPEMKEYYCFEMAPAAAVLDYRAAFRRKFDTTWDCPGLTLAGKTRRGGYVVEGAIPLSSLKQMCGADLLAGQPIRVGAFRAEYTHVDGEQPDAAWISWIHPNSEKPDFHIPSALGTFRIHK